MRKKAIAFLTMLTLALGLVPAFAFATTGGVTVQSASPANDVTIYRQLGTNTVTYFDGDDTTSGTATKLTEVADANKLVYSDLPTTAVDNYVLQGWYVKDSGSSSSLIDPTSYEGNLSSAAISLVAYYKPNPVTVHYVGQDGKDLTTVTASIGEPLAAATKPAAEAQAGYYTTNWYASEAEAAKDSGTAFKFGNDTTPDRLTGETWLYGKWAPRVYKVSYAAGTAGDSTNQGTPAIPSTVAYIQYGTGLVKWDSNSTAWVAVDANNKAKSELTGDAATAWAQATELTLAAATEFSAQAGTYSSFALENLAILDGTTAAKTYDAAGTIGNTELATYESFMSAGTNAGELDISLTAQWKPVWKVTFASTYGTPIPTTQEKDASWAKKADDPTANDYTSPNTVAFDEPEKLTTDGYVMDGWYAVDKNGAVATTKFNFAAVGADANLKAVWNKATYTATFHLDGVTIADATAETGGTFAEPQKDANNNNIAKDGYVLKADSGKVWYTDEACTKAYDFSTEVTKNIDLYAKWEPITYNIAFVGNGGTGTVAGKSGMKYSEDYTLPENAFTYSGQVFLGWRQCTTKTESGTQVFDAYVSDAEMKVAGTTVKELTKTASATVYFAPVWQQSYYVVFEANGTAAYFGPASDNKTEYKQPVPVNTTEVTFLKADGDMKLARTGYDFVNWNTLAAPTEANPGVTYGDGASYTARAGLQGDEEAIKLFAQWSANTYTLDYDANAADATGTKPETQHMKFDEGLVDASGAAVKDSGGTQITSITVAPTTTFKRDGYTLTGWNTKADGSGTKYSAGDTIAKDGISEKTTLYAQWTANKVTVSYKWAAADNDGTGDTGYKPTTAPSGVSDVTYTYGDTTAATTEWTFPSLEGYAKTGYDAPTVWVDAADDTKTYTPGEKFDTTTFKASVVLKPKWAAKKFAVTFYNFDGTEKLDTQSVDYNTAPVYKKGVAHEDPTYTDSTGQYVYTFVGWYNAKETVTAATTTSGTTTYNPAAIDLTAAKITADTSYYAMYTRETAKYSVIFSNNGVDATVPADQTVTYKDDGTVDTDNRQAYGAPIAEPAKAEAKDKDSAYEFVAWMKGSYDDSGNVVTEAIEFPYTLDGDLELVAVWKVADATKVVEIPEGQSLPYNRLPQSGVAEGAGYTLSGDVEATNAGDYIAVATLDEGYLWADGSAAPKYIDWSIEADADLANATKEQLYEANGAQIFANELLATVASSAKSGADVYVDKEWLSKEAYDELKDAIEKYQAAKDYYLGATSGDAQAMVDAYSKAAAATEKGTMKYKVAVPTAKTGLKYTGKAQTAVAAKAQYTVKGGSATKAGKYAATVTLKDTAKYQWAKSFNGKLTYSIAKAANTVTVKAKAVKAKAKKKATVAAKKAFTVSKAQGAVTYKKASGNKKITVSKAGKITIAKGLKKGTYSVKVKVTAAGNGNYKAATKTVTVKITLK